MMSLCPRLQQHPGHSRQPASIRPPPWRSLRQPRQMLTPTLTQPPGLTVGLSNEESDARRTVLEDGRGGMLRQILPIHRNIVLPVLGHPTIRSDPIDLTSLTALRKKRSCPDRADRDRRIANTPLSIGLMWKIDMDIRNATSGNTGGKVIGCSEKSGTTITKKDVPFELSVARKSEKKFPGLPNFVCVSSARLASLKEGQVNRKPKT